jgi:hypothetical protein
LKVVNQNHQDLEESNEKVNFQPVGRTGGVEPAHRRLWRR